MRRVFIFFRLPADDRRLLWKSLSLLWMVRIGLWILPFQRLKTLLDVKVSAACLSDRDVTSVQRITRCVTRMSRYVPSATCLTQALVAQRLLHKAGQPADLRIGVARSQTGKFEAHAWVEAEGTVVIGAAHTDLARFTVLRAAGL
jgi:Transglutaminase-like superfamily